MTNLDSKELGDGGRLPTGIPGLDAVSGGGFVRGAIYLVMGRPGTGKTTLANQLCFAHARRGGHAAYITLLAESHASMLKNLEQMRFYDASLVNRGVSYVGAYRSLREGQLRGLLDMVRRVIKDEKASLLVVDGISPARAMAETELALKEFVIELQMLSSMMGCTTILLANMTAEEANGPEHTMVDGLVELGFEHHRRRTTRTIEVLKFRGNRHVLGKSEVIITDRGFEAFPRVEEVINGVDRPPPSSDHGRVKTGVSGLDEMLSGGVLESSTTVILGFSGSGKTTLGLHFLNTGAELGENTCLFGFHESSQRILQAAGSVGLDLAKHAREERFTQLWRPIHEMGLDRLGAQLIAHVEKHRVRRLVIDSLDGFRLASADEGRAIHFVTALVNELRARGVTTLITDETLKLSGPEVEMRIDGMSALVDNLVLLRYVSVRGALRRLIYVLKERASDHELTPREFSLKARGIHVAPDGSTAVEILANTALFEPPYARRDSAEF